MKENLHKILSIGKTLTAYGLICGDKKQKDENKDSTQHPYDPYSPQALRFTAQEKLLIQPMIFMKNGSARQFVHLLVRGIAKNKGSETPTRVCDLIDEAEKLILPQALIYAQKFPENIMFQENLKDLKTMVKLYRRAYKRAAEEDKAQIVVNKPGTPMPKLRERNT